MKFVAHSIPKEYPARPPHLYSEHISEVLEYGMALLEYLLSFSPFSIEEKSQIKKTMTTALMLHDMGKLDKENQEILKGEKSGRLPVDHIEAGVAVAASIQNELLGWLIRGHHAPGLPSKKAEKYFIQQLNSEIGCCFPVYSLRGKRHKRTKEEAITKEDYENHFRAIERTEKHLSEYKESQNKCCGNWPDVFSMHLPQSGLTTRLLLSCLVDADHESAACYNNQIKMPSFEPANTRWPERLKALEKYVADLPKNPQNERDILRENFFTNCREMKLFPSKVVMCSAPVGSGKTTSVLAYLLRKSIESNASRIIVIAPFTNIINQTVKILRKSLVLNNEDPELAVAAYHHKLEFSSETMRQYSALWQAPIVVTTAVQFFETLASANPSRLRKLNSIAGASIFIDESHACLPVEFLKITWYWLKELADKWNCNIVFSSGSMVEFWNDSYILGCEDNRNSQFQVIPEVFPDLFPNALKIISRQSEMNRVEFRKIERPLSLNDIISLIQSENVLGFLQGNGNPSCLIILNTVQSCAVLANELARVLDDQSNKKITDKKVLHLSTALAPKDREKILDEIFRRQNYSEWENQPWYLIATSAVEAGVDLDFSIGFRERCSVTSFLQVSGRVNRHGKRSRRGVLYDFSLIPDDGLSTHPGFKESSIVFDDLWEELNSSEFSLTDIVTKAQRKEFSRFKEKREQRDFLCAKEEKLDFQDVSEEYKVIKSDTATVIINKEIVRKLELGIPVKWSEIQKNSVQLWSNKIKKWHLRPLKHCENDAIYSWLDTYDYDPIFLGIMDGILKTDDFFKNNGGVL